MAHICILKTGGPPNEIEAPSYPVMIAKSLGAKNTYTEYNAAGGDLPRAGNYDCCIITGSAAGVHDSDPWLDILVSWLRCLDRSTPLIGICFGHQVMATAYGGTVEAAPSGWAMGNRRYRVRRVGRWMSPQDEIVLPVSHRDQVTSPPANTTVLASSELCPFAMLAYTERRAISLQAHPEFSLDYTRKLIALRKQKQVITVQQAASALQSTEQASDGDVVSEWLNNFIRSSREEVTL